MKKLFTILILLISINSFAQDVVGSRVIARQSFFLRNTWIDSLRRDTLNWANDLTSAPTTGAVYKFVLGRIGGGVTSVGSGYGLTGGPITGAGALVFDSTTVFPQLRATVKQRFGVLGEDRILGQDRYINGQWNYGIEFDSLVYFNLEGPNSNFIRTQIGFSVNFIDIALNGSGGAYASTSSANTSGSSTIFGPSASGGNMYMSMDASATAKSHQIGSSHNIAGRWLDTKSESIISSTDAGGSYWYWDIQQLFGSSSEWFTNVTMRMDSTGWWARTHRKTGSASSVLYKGIRVDTSSNFVLENYPSSRADGTTAKALYINNASGDMVYGIVTPGVQGADVASLAGAIILGSDGSTFEITGTNAITLISNTNWRNGSEVTLIFTSTASLTDGTPNSGTNIGMELAGNANFTGSADDTITLILSEIGGTQRWREKCRSIN